MAFLKKSVCEGMEAVLFNKKFGLADFFVKIIAGPICTLEKVQYAVDLLGCEVSKH